jgi:kinesin family member C1
MVNLSPTEESFGESMCSLKFAQQVNQCELGKPKRQIKDMPAEASSCETPKPAASAKAPPSSSASSAAKRARTPVKSASASGVRPVKARI